jgi:hypothetical protein
MFSFFGEILNTFQYHEFLLEKGFDNIQRRQIADELGKAGENYRTKIYNESSSKKEILVNQDLRYFFEVVLKFIDQSISVNKRDDKLYHAYNLVSFTENEVVIRHLYEMLEGQVAVLTSGKLTPVEVIELLDALRNSSLYRADQLSYILYPNKKLPLFLDKNHIPTEDVNRIPLLQQLIAAGNTNIICKDNKGEFHFNANFNNAGFLTTALNKLKAGSAFEITENEKLQIEQLYERLFDHQSFTGRSGTFYKYEGLGCIYWHMVSKLLLAIGENIKKTISENADAEIIEKLKHHYAEVKIGIGAHKSPADYGSFPFDPYSHTPMMAGVQQPGMTGQVKEDVISRFFELGIQVENGCIKINKSMLKADEFIQSTSEKPYLKFSYCSVPFEYQLDGKEGIEIIYTNGNSELINAYSLNMVQSQAVFNRDKRIDKIIVHLKKL